MLSQGPCLEGLESDYLELSSENRGLLQETERKRENSPFDQSSGRGHLWGQLPFIKESLSVHAGAWPSCQVVCLSLGRIGTHRALGIACGNQLPSSLSGPACKHSRQGLQAQGLAAAGNL